MSGDSSFVPLVDLDGPGASQKVVGALQRSGFLLAQSGDLSVGLQQDALASCRELLTGAGAVVHPSDPKRYRMLKHSELEECPEALRQYWAALVRVKHKLLVLLALGLGLEEDFFTARHAAGNDTLRLLHYPPAVGAGNRCKEHSDYGTLTLLSTDSASGLEVWNGSLWEPVPFESAALVVNAGSLLSSWTKGSVRATLHRVAGPTSARSGTELELLRESAERDRYSLAFFVDPDPSVELKDLGAAPLDGAGVSVSDYVRWRCGATGEGVNFAPGELLEGEKT